MRTLVKTIYPFSVIQDYFKYTNRNSQRMDFIKRMFTPNDSAIPQITQLVASPQFTSVEALRGDYYEHFIGFEAIQQNRLKRIREVVNSYHTLTSLPAVIKGLTLVLATLHENKYEEKYLEVLEDLETLNYDRCPELQTQWVKQLTISMKSYLIRLPSLSHVFKRTQDRSNQLQLPFNTLLSDLYMLINLLNLLFPFVTNTFNTLGRYYLKQNHYYLEFYKRLSDHLKIIYDYIRLIVHRFVKEHKEIDIGQLKCFMKTLPEIELFCDKMEQLLLNKYFKGKGPSPKIYFNEEEVAEIHYQIKKKENSKEEVKTEDDQVFGEFQV